MIKCENDAMTTIGIGVDLDGEKTVVVYTQTETGGIRLDLPPRRAVAYGMMIHNLGRDLVEEQENEEYEE